MFNPFEKQPPADPPTEKQLNYARKLGITVSRDMSKWDVSDAIAEAERKNPKAKRQREHVKEKKRLKEHGPELIAAEQEWNHFAENVEYILAVYQRGKETIVDVLRVNEAYIDDRGKLKLGVAAPKLVKDRFIGDYLEWERNFELALDKLLYHEALHASFHDAGNDAYQNMVNRGLAIARTL